MGTGIDEAGIQLYHNLTVICGTAGAVMLILTIILFIVFDMKQVISRMLGLTEKKAIKEMEANTSFTSQLNVKYNKKMKNKVFTPTGSLKANMTPAERMLNQQSKSNIPVITPPPTEYGATEQISPGRQEQNVQASGDNVPVSLENETPDTTVLSDNGATTVLSGSGEPVDYTFMVVRQMMLIHTDEIVD